MDVGKFAKAYVAQKKIDYKYMGKDYGDADSLDYVDCTQVEYNGNYVRLSTFLAQTWLWSNFHTNSLYLHFICFNWQYYAKLGCSSQGGLKILAYSDAYCATEVNANIGLYNDIKVNIFFLRSWILSKQSLLKDQFLLLTFISCLSTTVTIALRGQQITTTTLLMPKATMLPKTMHKETTISNITINLIRNCARLQTTTNLLVVGDVNEWRIKAHLVRLTLPLGNIGMDWKNFSCSSGVWLVSYGTIWSITCLRF